MRWWAILSVSSVGITGRAAAEPAQPVPLRIAVYDVPPYGYVDADGSIAGLSVDLWRRVAERLGQQYRFIAVRDMEQVISGLEHNEYDAGIGAITITPERAERVDFSYPAHRSGVAVAFRKQGGPLSALESYAKAAHELGAFVLVIVSLLLLTGVLMWLIERPSQRAGHGDAAVATLRDGLYWAVVTMTTVGYGDKTPKTTSGRVVAMAWMFGSLVLVSLFSTSLVSRLTAERVERSDAAVKIDLRQWKLGAVGGSSGAEYLDRQHLPYAASANLHDALDLLVTGKTGAVVNSVGALDYIVAQSFAKDAEVSQGLLAPAYMAFALPRKSPLRRSIDEALMSITGGAEWTRLEDRFFGN